MQHNIVIFNSQTNLR